MDRNRIDYNIEANTFVSILQRGIKDMNTYRTAKKISALLLSFMILALALPSLSISYAAQEVSLTVTEDSVSGQCRLSGRLADDNRVYSVKVYKVGEEDKVQYLGYGKVGKNGRISHNFYLPEDAASGTYITDVGGDAMEVPKYTNFTHTKTTPAETAALVEPDGGSVLYEDDLSGFGLYCYHTGSEANFEAVFSENGTEICRVNFTANPDERTVKPITLSGLEKGIHKLDYVINRDGTKLASGTKTVAVIERYSDNYRESDASYGVHVSFVRRTAENEKELDLLHKAGISKIRNGNILGWSKVEKVPGVYDIAGETQFFINKLEEDNFTLLIGCAFGNALYGENDLNGPENKEQVDAFGRYVQELLKALPQIKVVEIWNEPDNATQFWGKPDKYAVEYAALVKGAAMAAREVRDDITILGGVVSSSVGGSNNVYIKRFIEQQIRPYVDGFSYHPYVNQKSIDWSYNGSWADSFTEPVKETGGWLDYYNSEMGYAIGTHNESYGGVNYVYSVDPKKQAEYLVKLYAYNAQMDVKETYWYNGRNVGTNTGYLEDMFGLMEKDFTPKPAYAALSQLSCRLNGGRYIGPVSFGNGIEGSLFHVNGELTAVAWVPEKRDLSKPSEGCIDSSVTANYTFDNADFVLRDMYGNEQTHGKTVTFTTSPVYLSGLGKNEAAKAVAAAISELGGKYGVTGGINAIGSFDWASATASSAAEYIGKIYKQASNWIGGSGSDFTNRMKQAEGFSKIAECAAAYYSYLYEGTANVSDAELTAAKQARDAKLGGQPAEAMTFTSKMLRKADNYYKRAAEILGGGAAVAQNGFAAADMLVSNGLVSMANAVVKQENPDPSYGILVYTNPTYPTVAQYSKDGFQITVDNRSGKTLDGKLVIKDANGIAVSAEQTISLADGRSAEKHVVLSADSNTALGINGYTIEITSGGESFTAKTFYATITEGSEGPGEDEEEPKECSKCFVERDILSDSYTIHREDHEGELFSVKMSNAGGDNVHLSFATGKSYTYQLSPDVANGSDYTVTLGSPSESQAEKISGIAVYSAGAKLSVLNEINRAENETAVENLLKTNADVLELNRHPVYNAGEKELSALNDEEWKAIAKTVCGAASYESLKDFYEVYYFAKALILLNRAANAQEALKVGEIYDAYLDFSAEKGYKLVSGFVNKVYPYYAGKGKITEESAKAAFGEYAFLCAVSNAENYQQIVDAFADYSDLVTFDLTTWNKSVQSLTAQALLGKNYATMTELELAIENAYKEQQKDTKKDHSSGGGSGKGNYPGSSAETVNGSGEDGKQTLYRDMNETHWAYDTVRYLTEKKVVNGDEAGNFNPENAVTRAEFAKMIVSGFGLYHASATCDFADIPQGHWAYPYIASLAEKGVINGIDENFFGGDMLISRQDMAVMLARISSIFSDEGNLTFDDSSDIADYAAAAVASLSSLGIIKGYENNTYCPRGNATRAEAATVISRSMKLFIGGTTQ